MLFKILSKDINIKCRHYYTRSPRSIKYKIVVNFLILELGNCKFYLKWLNSRFNESTPIIIFKIVQLLQPKTNKCKNCKLPNCKLSNSQFGGQPNPP